MDAAALAVVSLLVPAAFALPMPAGQPSPAPPARESLQDQPRLPILDDATLGREYEQYRASVTGMRSYRVRYIRAATESAARDLIAMISAGADFEDVARRHSIHGESAGKDGDLGTHAACRWAKSTLAMLESLEEGQIWPDPVKGTHGWGIYRLESAREIEPRGFERYKDELLAGRFEPECPWVPPVTGPADLLRK